MHVWSAWLCLGTNLIQSARSSTYPFPIFLSAKATKSHDQIERQLIIVSPTGTSRIERRNQARSKRDSFGVTGTSTTAKRSHKISNLRKSSTRFDKNRRLSSVDSDSPTPRNSGDPYGGFSYEGTPDRIRKIDINSMSVFGKKDPVASKVVVFGGEKYDLNNNELPESPTEISVSRQLELNAVTDSSSNDIETSNFVQRLGHHRREKYRRKSRDQRRESFNRLRNIHGDAILHRSSHAEYKSDNETYTVVDSSQIMFEILAQQKALDRPSEVLPRDVPRQSIHLRNQLDPFEDVVTSSTGMNQVTCFPMLDRFSEIFRIAKLQREKFSKPSNEASEQTEVCPADTVSKERYSNDQHYKILVAFAGLSFSALVFSLYLHYVDFRVARQ